MTGTLEDGTRFDVRVDVSETLRLEGPFEVTGQARLIVSFDLNGWLTPDDFDGLEPDVDGVLHLDPDTAGDAHGRIADAIRASARLVRDNNNNGVFDDGDDVIATSDEATEP